MTHFKETYKKQYRLNFPSPGFRGNPKKEKIEAIIILFSWENKIKKKLDSGGGVESN